MIVTLIGYRGTGKSTVAQQLAARLNWECCDSDKIIEARTGTSIADIFAEDGEPHFRHLERVVLDELLQRENVVVSAGGGAVLDEVTRHAMSEAGPVVWLKASPQTILERINSDPNSAKTRPALTDADPLDEIKAKLLERNHYYGSIAALIVDTDERNVTSIVDEIVAQLAFDDNLNF